MQPPPPSTTPRFSVVVLTYNREALLPRALASILSQLTQEHEVQVVDDGSTDGTAALLASYGDRIRVVRQDHLGTAVACQTAYHQVRSQWMIFVDSDDELRPGALAALRAAADAHPTAALVLARTCAVHADGKKHDLPPATLSKDRLENFRAFARGKLRGIIAGGLIRRDLLTPFDHEGLEGVHSADLAVLGAALMREVVQIDAVTLEVHAHAASLRNNIQAIHASGMRVVDLLFDPAALPPEALALRPVFESFMELERSRAYHRAGWHGPAWRSYVAALKGNPGALLQARHLRRAISSSVKDLFRRPEGPVVTPPGRHAWPLWNDSIQFLYKITRGNNAVVRLRVKPQTYVLCNPEDGQHVLVSNFKSYHKTGILKIDPILAGGFIGMDLPIHGEQRKSTPVNFGKQVTNNFLADVGDLIAGHIDGWDHESPSAVGLYSQKMFIEVAGRLIFGCGDAGRMQELTTLLATAHQFSRREMRARYRWPGWVAPAWVPLKRRRRSAEYQRKLRAWMESLSAARGEGAKADMLSMMCRNVPAENHEERVRVGMIAMMTYLGSMEPGSITLAWALELLSDKPEIQDRIAAEVASIAGAGVPTPEQVAQLTYTAQVINETTRLYPNEWLLTRRAIAEDRLPSGLRVRVGEEVMISPYLYGHDPRFFPEPERFNPDRFAGPPTWPQGAFIPFGSGPRSCIGEHIVKRLLTLSLALLTQRYRVEPCPEGRGQLESPNLFTSQPAESRILVKLSRR